MKTALVVLAALPLAACGSIGSAERPPKPIGLGDQIEARDWSYESRWYGRQDPNAPGQQENDYAGGWRMREADYDGQYRWESDRNWRFNRPYDQRR
jgi:hypothetical protein